jgi:Polysaccharide pyruvyl transferase
MNSVSQKQVLNKSKQRWRRQNDAKFIFTRTTFIRIIILVAIFASSMYNDSILNRYIQQEPPSPPNQGQHEILEQQEKQEIKGIVKQKYQQKQQDNPNVVLVSLEPFFPCNGKTVKITCQKTLLVNDLFSYSVSKNELDTILQPFVCNELLRKGNAQSVEAPVCLQSADLVHVLVHYKPWMTTMIYDNITMTQFVQTSDESTVNKFIQNFPVSVQVIPKRQIDFPLSYIRMNDKTNRLYEEHIDGNFGNLVWRYGASTMINSVTIDIDGNDIWNRKNLHERPVDALVIASANLLHINQNRIYFDEIVDKIRYIKLRNVTTILLGVGVQYDFEEGKQDYNLTLKNLKLPYKYQETFLSEISSRQNIPAIGVRGDLTKSVCQNSGISHCVSTGCPSLTISRDINLGRTLESSWLKVKKNLEEKGGDYSIKIALAAPTLGIGRTFRTAYRLMATLIARYGNQVTLIAQSEQDPVRFNDYLQTHWKTKYPTSWLLNESAIKYEQYRNVESWLEGTKKYDLCISFRIHGSMPFYSSGIPAVIIPTDFRIMELISAMKLPHILPDQLNRLMLSNAISDKEGASLPLLLMNAAKNTNFTAFEVNRRAKITMWKSILGEAGLELDPALLRITQSPL